MSEHWDDEDCLVESEELGPRHRHETRAADPIGMPCVAVFGGDYTHWLAERTWEDEGGLVPPQRERTRPLQPVANGRQSHVAADHRVSNARGRGPERQAPRGADGAVPRLRPHLAGVAGR